MLPFFLRYLTAEATKPHPPPLDAGGIGKDPAILKVTDVVLVSPLEVAIPSDTVLIAVPERRPAEGFVMLLKYPLCKEDESYSYGV